MPEEPLPVGEISGYLKPEDAAQLESAYRFSETAHSGQFRISGEPYISHPLAVAGILAEWRLDAQTLIAALLHDVMEDTSVTKDQIADLFGQPVADLVDGVSKLDRIEFQTKEDAQAENFRKMLLAMASDVRVILIKLADRLHNMRTLDVMYPGKRKRIARETLEIYAQIANRMGLNSIYQELEDLSFKHLYPLRYRVLSKATKAARGNRREVVGKIMENILQRLKEAGIDAQTTGREKHLYSIYRKMAEKKLSFSEVQDIYGFRVVVRDIPTCYYALGALHGLYKPIPGKFKDYIALPKSNGYQSLHTSLFGPYGTPIEIQIRTVEMHKIAEAGVASHWLYKSSEANLSEMQRKTHQWLQSLLESLGESSDSVEFLEHLKVDLFPDEIYVFTPKGKILVLPKGATPVDFAYSVHTDIGSRCLSVRINGELKPLRTQLRNGDTVEILTAPYAKPNPAWLEYVITGKARTHIRHYLKTMQYEQSAQLGERLLNQAMAALKVSPESIDDGKWDKLLKSTGAKSRQDILTDIGLGRRLGIVVAKRLSNWEISSHEEKPLPLVIRGSEGMAVEFAKCCSPIPGDPILGFIKKGQGLTIHTHDCPVVRKSRVDPAKCLDVEWDSEISRQFDVSVKLEVRNQRGVLARVAAEIAEAGSNIENISMEGEGSYTTINFTIQVNNRMHLAQVMRSLRRIPDVVRISRVKA
ncbi:MAG: bifunctional (p)ppGpp synthetase/guanosine-3',5'-bis(diphosphate) 3'-pyrophosphohydrolase [Burkholderiales bacterium]|nr:bifunctional (p)ppGpp synthetase/guanosine-3',5'-bis(diphosphate) 3'-pyrophosphohydrolase [Burkholderiales bacterium]